jgi:hypothetical protein
MHTPFLPLPAAVLLLSSAAALAEAAPATASSSSSSGSMSISFAPKGFKQAMDDRDEAMRNKCPGGMMDCEWLPATSPARSRGLAPTPALAVPPVLPLQCVPSFLRIAQPAHPLHLMQVTVTAGTMPSSSGQAFWSGAGRSASGASPRTRRQRRRERLLRQTVQANELLVLDLLLLRLTTHTPMLTH